MYILILPGFGIASHILTALNLYASDSFNMLYHNYFIPIVGVGKETRYWNYFEHYWLCAGVLSTVVVVVDSYIQRFVLATEETNIRSHTKFAIGLSNANPAINSGYEEVQGQRVTSW